MMACKSVVYVYNFHGQEWGNDSFINSENYFIAIVMSLINDKIKKQKKRQLKDVLLDQE